jgi:hypothetical protein
VACAVIRQGFSEYGIEPAELLEEGHVFTRHFRPEEASRVSPVGLQALVAAANQVESFRPGFPSAVTRHHLARDMQAQQQVGAHNESQVAGQVPGLVPYEMNTDPASNDRQDMRSPWQMYTHHNSEAIRNSLVGPHVPVAVGDQVQSNALGLQADIPQQQLPSATLGVAASDQQVCIEPIQLLSDIETRWPQGRRILPYPAHHGDEACVYESYHDGIVSNQEMMMPGQDGHFWSLDWDDIQ